MGSCSPNYWVLKVLLVGFCWLLLVGLVISTSFCSTSTSSGSTRAVLMGRTSPRNHEEVVMGNKERKKQKKELVYNPELDLNYVMSNRKVPNGPDPIHNKKRPPGQA